MKLQDTVGLARPFFQRYGWTVILGIGALLRLLFLDAVPGGLHQDEASTGYDAWALLQEGIDRNGFSWPVQFLSWGSGQNTLYALLSMPFIALGGLNLVTIRVAMALAGVAALLIFFDLGRRTGDKALSVLAGLVLALSPWHLMASRWGSEANILPFTVLLAVWFVARVSETKPQPMIFAASAVLGLSVYAYGTAWVFAPLLFGLIILILQRRYAVSLPVIFQACGIFLLVTLPLYVFVINNLFGSQSFQIGPFSFPFYGGVGRHTDTFLPLRPDGWSLFWKNISNLGRMIFGGGTDGMPWNAIPGFGAIFVVCTPFFLWGAVSVIRTKGRNLTDSLMLAWLSLALFLAVLTNANINRINLIWLPLCWFSARGFWELRAGMRTAFRLSMALFLAWSLFFVLNYFIVWPREYSAAYHAGADKGIAAAIEKSAASEPILVTDRMNMPYITALFVSRTPPREYLATRIIANPGEPFQQVPAFGRFRFGIQAPDHLRYRIVMAHQTELEHFDPALWDTAHYGNYALLLKRQPQVLPKAAPPSSPGLVPGAGR